MPHSLWIAEATPSQGRGFFSLFAEEASRPFNAVSLLLSVVGILFGIVGLYIAVVQLRKIEKSADAAKSAAIESRESIKSIVSLVNVERACAIGQQAAAYFESRELKLCATRLGDLRTELARLLPTNVQMVQVAREDFSSLLVRIGDLEQTMLKYAGGFPSDAQTVRARKFLGQAIEDLNTLAGRAVNVTGELQHANTN